MTVKTRIAPSPTGDPHVGTGYIALFNYCFAKQAGGKFVLRVEDTDQTRSAPEYEQAIMDALKWLGVQWDEGPDVGGPCGPYRQSERKEIYDQHVQMLLDNGSAYRCFCTPERLKQMREERMGKEHVTGYDGLCKGLSNDDVDAKLQNGLPFVVRLEMPKEGDSIISDRLRGEISYPNYQQDDQVLLKSDGYPTYHLANVVDDHLMGITHVIRAEEWIPSTPKHQRLYEAFGWEAPEFIHMPLLRNKDKSKISKRKNPTSIMYYKKIGILPEAMLNFMGLMSYSAKEDEEKFSLAEMLETFDISKVKLGGPVFDLEKLNWLNGLYIREMGLEVLTDTILERCFSREYIREIAPLIQERIDKFNEFIPKSGFFFDGAMEYDSALLVGKKMTAADMVPIFNELIEDLDRLIVWSTENIEQVLREFGERNELKARAYFMPVRIAITGRKASPPLFETMEVIGKPLCQQRMREALTRLKVLKKQESKKK